MEEGFAETETEGVGDSVGAGETDIETEEVGDGVGAGDVVAMDAEGDWVSAALAE